METIYLIAFLVGAALMVCQFFLSLVGLGGHHDVGGHDVHDVGSHDDLHGTDHGHDHHGETLASWFVSLLTFRTLVAALLFFGLAGLAGHAAWGPDMATVTFLVALASGAAALFLVATLMRSLHRLKAEGTVRMERAVGHSGTVYLPIPGGKAGVGKVQLNLQNRTVECQAITAHEQLPTGAKVVVVAVLSPDTVEVASATSAGE
jgi:membrane protein implicated in regulation of membrane protease activity